MGGQGLPTFGVGDLGGKVLDGVNAADENVAQGFAGRFGIVDRLHGRRDRMIGRGGHGMHDRHGLLTPRCRRDRRGAIRVLLVVPLGERLVVAPFTGMEQAGRGLGVGRHGSGVGPDFRRWGSPVLGFSRSRQGNRDHEGTVRVSDDVHDAALLAQATPCPAPRSEIYPDQPATMPSSSGT
jgi:hypothetical protein